MLLTIFTDLVNYIRDIDSITRILVMLACIGVASILIIKGIKTTYNVKDKKDFNVLWLLFGFVLVIVGFWFYFV